MQLLKQNNVAILVFANSSQEELKHKAIPKGNVLFDMLTAQTLETVSKSKLPSFHFSEEQQIGNSFAERFTNAVQTVFDKGYEQIITIGNDSPQLQVSHILESADQLRNRKFVLGPSADGGLYLMGLHKSQFNAVAFKKLAWQTSNLSKELLRLISKTAIAVFRLPTFFDIDTAQDIKSFISYAYHLPEKLLTLFLGILGSKKEGYDYSPLASLGLHSKTFYNKGSPVVL